MTRVCDNIELHLNNGQGEIGEPRPRLTPLKMLINSETVIKKKIARNAIFELTSI